MSEELGERVARGIARRVLTHSVLGVLTVVTGGLTAGLHAVAEAGNALADMVNGADALATVSDAVDMADTAGARLAELAQNSPPLDYHADGLRDFFSHGAINNNHYFPVPVPDGGPHEFEWTFFADREDVPIELRLKTLT